MQTPALNNTPQKSAFWTTESKLAYMLLFPAIAVLLLFMFYPILYVFLMAFYKTNKLGRIVSFIGFGNFNTLFQNKAFWEVTIRSVIWTILAVASKTVAGLVIALLLNVEFIGRRIYRTLVIIPGRPLCQSARCSGNGLLTVNSAC
jgi:ABC-type sugar transport system permease subunit